MRATAKYKPPGGLYLEGRFNGGFFTLRVRGAYIWRGLYTEGLIFGILRYMKTDLERRNDERLQGECEVRLAPRPCAQVP